MAKTKYNMAFPDEKLMVDFSTNSKWWRSLKLQLGANNGNFSSNISGIGLFSGYDKLV